MSARQQREALGAALDIACREVAHLLRHLAELANGRVASALLFVVVVVVLQQRFECLVVAVRQSRSSRQECHVLGRELVAMTGERVVDLQRQQRSLAEEHWKDLERRLIRDGRVARVYDRHVPPVDPVVAGWELDRSHGGVGDDRCDEDVLPQHVVPRSRWEHRALGDWSNDADASMKGSCASIEEVGILRRHRHAHISAIT